MSEPQLPSAPLLRGMLTRRSMLYASGGSGWQGCWPLAAAAAPRRWRHQRAPSTAASVDASSAAPSGGAEDKSDTDKIVNWSNWPEYIDVDDKTKKHPTLDAFTAADRHQGQLHRGLNDNDEFFAKVKPQLERRSGHRPRHVVPAPTGWSRG